ncbi:SRPBCC domain-containing protein [uncultured Sphingomonas sp.]|uniref:SRPBCC domain-containing protein n=1 Tax=uncultured Sphingomonas sp. TaxID=158754 RepID=UPI0035CAB949
MTDNTAQRGRLPATKRIAGFTPDPGIVWPEGHTPGSSRVFAQNSIEIAATPEKIWSLLIDCQAWPSWYVRCSDVSMLSGGPLLGPDASFRFKTLGFYFEPRIDTFDPARLLVWSAKGPAGTSGAHAWHITPLPGGCRVVTEEAQKGLLLALIGGRTRKTLLKCHGEWLRALKELAERR